MIFSEEECKFLIKIADLQTWKYADTGGIYHRVIMINDALAEEIHSRIGKYIPDKYEKYKTSKINNHFRYSRYIKGRLFHIHCDGQNYDKSGTISFINILIVINDDFEGGETNFYTEKKVNLNWDIVLKLKLDVVHFYHDQYHTGNKVIKPYKYLIRTDVLGFMS